MKILAIIPARGGSKGVPGKNTKLLAGKPLIQYTIDAALDSHCFAKVMVSTDSPAIAKVASELGAEVPELRPAEFATDTSPTIDTIIYTLGYYQKKGEHFNAVCLLQPTSPMRTVADIECAIKAFEKLQTDSLVTVLPVPHEFNPHWVFKPDDSDLLKVATGDSEIIPRRQDLPKAFYRNGVIYLTLTHVVLAKHSLYGDSIGYYEMSSDQHINIDTMEDWEMAEKLMKKRNA